MKTADTIDLHERITRQQQDRDRIAAELDRAAADASARSDTEARLIELETQIEDERAKAYIERREPSTKPLEKAVLDLHKAGAEATAKRQGAAAAARVLHRQMDNANEALQDLERVLHQTAHAKAVQACLAGRQRIQAVVQDLLRALTAFQVDAWQVDVLAERLHGPVPAGYGMSLEAMRLGINTELPTWMNRAGLMFLDARSLLLPGLQAQIDARREQMATEGLDIEGPPLIPNRQAEAPGAAPVAGLSIQTDAQPGDLRIVQADPEAIGLIATTTH